MEHVIFLALGGALNSLPQTIHFFIIFRVSLKSPTALRLRGDFIQAWLKRHNIYHFQRGYMLYNNRSGEPLRHRHRY